MEEKGWRDRKEDNHFSSQDHRRQQPIREGGGVCGVRGGGGTYMVKALNIER